MKLTFLTLFPPILSAYLNESIMSRAIENGIITCDVVNIRDFADDKHRTCDDYPYGGGAGMVFKPEPLAASLDSVITEYSRVIYPSPSGRVFTQSKAEELSRERHLVFICGRYEGIDQRIIDSYVDDEYCIGDYVLSSGEIASLVIADSVYRLVRGVINGDSLDEESFSNGLVEYPHYTRPEIFNNIGVPEILKSGHHENIRKWRLEQQIRKTIKNRPDLVENGTFADEVQRMIDTIKNSSEGDE